MILKDKIRILPDKPVSVFGHDHLQTCEAEIIDNEERKQKIFAVICKRELPPRHDKVEAYTSIDSNMMLRYVESGIVKNPHTQNEVFAIVYEKPQGALLGDNATNVALEMKMETVVQAIIIPCIQALRHMADRDYPHGNICLSNIYGVEVKGELQYVILGDSLSMPCGYAQPYIYETIPRSQTDPIGRGRALASDDMYALGVTLALATRESDPLEGFEKEDIIKAKIRDGSYTALIGKQRIRGPMMELLRGLLHDDPIERWTLEDLIHWADGKRLSPKQSYKSKKATRPLDYAGKHYAYARTLAMDFNKNPVEARRLHEEGEIYQWLERSLMDDTVLKNYEKISDKIQYAPPNYMQDVILSGIPIALDPAAPVHMQEVSTSILGIGTHLMHFIAESHNLKPLETIIHQNIFDLWIETQEQDQDSYADIAYRLVDCRKALQSTKLGVDIERCLYTLNPDAYCLSPLLKGYYIMSPEDILRGLDGVCSDGTIGKKPLIDKHIAAFLSVREPSSIDNSLYDLNSGDSFKESLAYLKCFGKIQRKYGIKSLPHLSKVLMNRLDVVFEKLHNKEARDELKKEVSAYADKGQIFKMADTIANEALWKRDARQFLYAKHEYALLSHENMVLEQKLLHKKGFENSTGREIATLIACGFAFLLIAFIIFLHSTKSVIM